jgi:hypothetical protein
MLPYDRAPDLDIDTAIVRLTARPRGHPVKPLAALMSE